MRPTLAWFAVALTACSTQPSDAASTTAQSAPAVPAECTPDGTAIDGWQWYTCPSALGRDGKATGYAIRKGKDPSRVVVYFDWGGACFDWATCGYNELKAGRKGFGYDRWTQLWKTSLADSSDGRPEGVLQNDPPGKEFDDATQIFIAYGTGDVFAGTAQPIVRAGKGGYIDTVASDFHGYKGTKLRLASALTVAADANTCFNHVVAAGISAGAFGAQVHYPTIHNLAQNYRCGTANVPVTMIADSAPPLAKRFLAPNLLETWFDTWHLGVAFAETCGATCAQRTDDYLINNARTLLQQFPNERFVWISSVEDDIIRRFFNANLLVPLPAIKFTEGLQNMQQALKSHANAFTFFPLAGGHWDPKAPNSRAPGCSANDPDCFVTWAKFNDAFGADENHTWIRYAGFNNAAGKPLPTTAPPSVTRIPLAEWLDQIIRGDTPKYAHTFIEAAPQ